MQEVVNGQQRLTTIYRFIKNEFENRTETLEYYVINFNDRIESLGIASV